ncbi:unnamed protein product [Arctogadus glacialis]
MREKCNCALSEKVGAVIEMFVFFPKSIDNEVRAQILFLGLTHTHTHTHTHSAFCICSPMKTLKVGLLNSFFGYEVLLEVCVKFSQMGLFCYLYLYCCQSAKKSLLLISLFFFFILHTCYCLLFISCCIKVCCKGPFHRAPALIGSKPHKVTLYHAHIWLPIHDFLITFPLKSLVFVIFVVAQCALQKIFASIN